MEQKVHLHNLNEGVYQRLLETYRCNGCGLVPHYTLNRITSGSSVNISLKGWDRIDDLVHCPSCIRSKKIKKLINIKF